MITLPALTVHQPWAWAIACGAKPVENRGRGTPHRGPFAIHAGKTWDENGQHSPLVHAAWRERVPRGIRPSATSQHIVFGAVIAVATLTGICTVRGGRGDCSCGPWAVPGQCHWLLDGVRALPEPVPARGMQGLWPLPEDVDAAVRQQLKAVTA